MRALLKGFLFAVVMVLSIVAQAETMQNYWYSTTEGKQVKLRVDLYLSSTCPHCQKTDAFFKEQEGKLPWLEVHRNIINQDKTALDNFHHELQMFGDDNYAVPAIFFCKTHWIGFDTELTSGMALLRGLNYCHDQIMKTGSLDHESQLFLKQLAGASWLSASMTAQPTMIYFLPMIALFDVLSSCSLFCVFALFSFIWLHREFKVKLGLGIVFILAVALAHHYQQVHTEIFYHLFGWIRVLAILTGLALIGYCLFIYYRRSTDHPGIAVPVLVGLTALLTESYQQSCSPNFALFFQQWLMAQSISTWDTEFYTMIYLLVYLIPLIILLFIFIKLDKVQRLKPYRTLMVCVAWCLLMILGFLLVFMPFALAGMKISIFLLLIAIVACFLMLKQKERLGLTWHE